MESDKEIGMNINALSICNNSLLLILQSIIREQEKNKMGPSGCAPSAWQHYELLHSFLGAFRIHNMEQNTLANERMSPYLYLYRLLVE